MSKPIKIWFSDFWTTYQDNEPFFTPLLKKHFNIELHPKPDVLIHSVFGKNFLKYNCTRVCYTGENTRPDYTRSDYHIGFDFTDDPRYLRWPNFLRYYRPERFIEPKDVETIYRQKTKFCAFVISNDRAQERIQLFHDLSVYKKVDSGGKALNNIGYPIDNKVDFIKNYKFTIAYENSSYPGYTTEKIYEPFLMNSVPIYWGNSRVTEDFNAKAFINANDFNSQKELLEYIAYVDQNENVYKGYLKEPCFIDNQVPEKFKELRIIEYFNQIFDSVGKIKIVAQQKDYFDFYKIKIKNKLIKLINI